MLQHYFIYGCFGSSVGFNSVHIRFGINFSRLTVSVLHVLLGTFWHTSLFLWTGLLTETSRQDFVMRFLQLFLSASVPHCDLHFLTGRLEHNNIQNDVKFQNSLGAYYNWYIFVEIDFNSDSQKKLHVGVKNK